MKLTLLFASTALLAANAVLADNCYGDLAWCGHNLIKRGDYYWYIKDQLQGMGKPADDTSINNSLWHCEPEGELSYRTTCSLSCNDGGSSSNNDYCSLG